MTKIFRRARRPGAPLAAGRRATVVPPYILAVIPVFAIVYQKTASTTTIIKTGPPRRAALGLSDCLISQRRLKNAFLPGYSATLPASSHASYPSSCPADRTHSFRCSSFPDRTRFVGLRPGSRSWAILICSAVLMAQRRLKNAFIPGYSATSPSSSSMRSNWLYLATRSVRLGAPVLI